MGTRMPALFLSHGAPSIITDDCPTRDFLLGLGQAVGRPKAIVSVSAHWTTQFPMVTRNPSPATIHDFGGFAPELHSLTYPAPGDPALAELVLSLLGLEGIEGGRDMSRGFDHGTWVPLMLMYPDAKIPVVQLSVQPQMSPEHHLAMGKALRPLLEDGILIVASGSTTHNLANFFGRNLNDPPLPYAREFAEWLAEAVIAGRTEEVLNYRERGPHAKMNHPTPEHFLPLFVAMGTGGKGRLLHDGYSYGALSMAAFSWT